jgi:SAM-dependent methyltransferase
LNILEIGAGEKYRYLRSPIPLDRRSKGTGSLTKNLTEVLGRHDNLIGQYVVSDISIALANTAARSCAYPHVSACAYNISKPPEEQGLHAQSFDIITAFYVVHAAPDLAVALESLRQLLVPGGCLLVCELDASAWKQTPGSLWHDMVFGSFAEWFGSTDGREHCALTPASWASTLESVGFTDVQTVSDPALTNLDFTFVAQKPYDPTTIASVSFNAKPHFFSYTYGDEAKLQGVLSNLDANASIPLWLLASEGIDGDAGAGLVYTLVKEFEGWDIHLGVFPQGYETQGRIDTIVRYNGLLDQDTVVYFTSEGIPMVPKAVPCPPPAAATSFDPSAPWVSDKAAVKPIPAACVIDEEVVVEPFAWSQASSSLRGLVGTVIESRYKNLPVGSLVAGISDTGELSNRFISEGRYLVQIPVEVANLGLAGGLLSILVAGLLLDRRHTRTTKRLRVLIPEPKAIPAVSHILEQANILGDVEVGTPPQDDGFDLIVLDSATNSVHPEFSSWLNQGGRVLVWDTMLRETDRLDQLFTTGLLYYSPTTKAYTKVITPGDILATSTTISVELPLFKPDRAYILLGGASDLGVVTALWMYQVGPTTFCPLSRELIDFSQHGARHLILTSRRGAAFLDATDAVSTKQKFRYLEKRSDLVFRVEAFNAADVESMRSFAQTITSPIGGCFLMILHLIDGLFITQTQDTFHTISRSKLDAFQAFASVFDVGSLDFFMSFSSMIAVTGNIGQSNYATANALLDGELRKYPNAFSLMIPGISNVGYLARSGGDAEHSRLDSWSITPDSEPTGWV